MSLLIYKDVLNSDIGQIELADELAQDPHLIRESWDAIRRTTSTEAIPAVLRWQVIKFLQLDKNYIPELPSNAADSLGVVDFARGVTPRTMWDISKLGLQISGLVLKLTQRMASLLAPEIERRFGNSGTAYVIDRNATDPFQYDNVPATVDSIAVSDVFEILGEKTRETYTGVVDASERVAAATREIGAGAVEGLETTAGFSRNWPLFALAGVALFIVLK